MVEAQLPNYDEIDFLDDQEAPVASNPTQAAAAAGAAAKTTTDVVGVHSTSFKDMVLRPELQQSIVDCGFEHPSDVQQKCIPQAIMGVDILCQAVSGMGKTAVFVLSSLHCVGESPQPASVLVLAHARELAYQIKGEFTRLAKFIPDIRTECILGGEPLEKQKKLLKGPKTPHIIVGTPGRILHLAKDKSLNLDNLKMFILDECDKVLDNVGKFSFLPAPLDFNQVLSMIDNRHAQ